MPCASSASSIGPSVASDAAGAGSEAHVYRLLLPEEPVQLSRRGHRATTPQAAGGEIEKKQKRRYENAAAMAKLMAEALALPDLLRARRETWAARWRAI
jgi:hypothetical protein